MRNTWMWAGISRTPRARVEYTNEMLFALFIVSYHRHPGSLKLIPNPSLLGRMWRILPIGFATSCFLLVCCQSNEHTCMDHRALQLLMLAVPQPLQPVWNC